VLGRSGPRNLLLGNDAGEVIEPILLARLEEIGRVRDEVLVVERQDAHEAEVARAQKWTCQSHAERGPPRTGSMSARWSLVLLTR